MNVYICKNNLKASAEFLSQTESTLEGKTVEQVMSILETRIKNIYGNMDADTFKRDLLRSDIIYRGVYSLPAFCADHDNSGKSAIYVNLYTYLGGEGNWNLQSIANTKDDLNISLPPHAAMKRNTKFDTDQHLL